MRGLALTLTLAIAGALCLPAAAGASFGLHGLDVSSEAADGSVQMQAGAHPFALTTSIAVDTKAEEANFPDGEAKDVQISLPAGFAGDPTAVPRCTAVQFLTGQSGECPDASALGTAFVEFGAKGEADSTTVPVYNLYPSPGKAAKLGFIVEGKAPVTIDLGLSPSPPYNVIVDATNISQGIFFLASRVSIWGVPAAHSHDGERGSCLGHASLCEVSIPEVPFLTLPTACLGPLATRFEADSWQQPGAFFEASVLTHDDAEPPNPLGIGGCGKLGFEPTIAAKPTTRAAQSPSGLDFSLDVEDEGLTNPTGLAQSAIRKAVVTLPEGMSVNPSQAEGLAVCTEAELARETPFSAPGEGCPQASKVGTIEVETPLLEGELLKGSLFVAEPYHNLAGDSLIAVYVVIKDPGLGILVTQPLRVSPDPVTGRLVSTAEEMPQLPFSHFRLHFREGGRAPLISPPGCGDFATTATLYPYSGGAPVTTSSAFQIVSGPGEGPCPQGAAPFHPGFKAGSLNNAAKAYSPFYMRLTRQDGEQDLTKFSSVLPPGVVGKLAGVPYCPEAGIARAMSRSGEHGGTAELADPSCPAASQIGRTLAGAGVGSELTYVPGRLYLAGPYHGDPLSVVSITPAVAGPFDAGTVVVREALTLNPVSAEVEVDGAASDPIPHILQGIPLNVRDLRVYVDRPEFTLNATSCAEEQARATLWGGGTVLAPMPDSPVALSSRYQAAGCASLGFKPRLAIKLKGGTRRGAHPALRAVVTPKPGDANFAGAVVTLPHSAFLDQAHIRTICTRVQFAAGQGNGAQCPKAAVYGQARAWSPLLDEPLEGPVFLRSSNHKLPDMVLALHGLVDIDLAARIDSVKGGIRSTFAAIPDAPVSRFVLDMQGAKKGLIVNSTDLCAGRHRARATLRGQNGRIQQTKPIVRATKCGKTHRKHHRRHHRRRRRGVPR